MRRWLAVLIPLVFIAPAFVTDPITFGWHAIDPRDLVKAGVFVGGTIVAAVLTRNNPPRRKFLVVALWVMVMSEFVVAGVLIGFIFFWNLFMR